MPMHERLFESDRRCAEPRKMSHTMAGRLVAVAVGFFSK
jgi:hypothetical protein